VVPEEPPSNARLDSWKEIAAYLKRDVTTVRRWEKREGLPVHRHLHHRRDSIYAYAGELDGWLEARRHTNEVATAAGIRPAVSAVATAAVLVIGAIVGIKYLRMDPAEPPAARLTFSVPHPLILADAATGGQFSISRDGTAVVFAASAPDGTHALWIRRLDSLTAERLPGTVGATYPFWSPDGRFVAFFAQQKLKTIPVAGGAVQTLADALLPRGGTWSRAGTIVFSADAGEHLYRVSSAGGQVTRVALDSPNRESHWPDFLPDGRHFLFLGRRQKSGIYVGSIDSPQTRLLATGYIAAGYAAPGYLLLLTGGAQSETSGTLMVQRFDASGLRLIGKPVPLANSVAIRPSFVHGVFSTSDNGTVLYGTSRHQVTQLLWLDRDGKQVGSVTGRGRYERTALSVDEKTVAVEVIDSELQTPDIWLIETGRQVASRFTTNPAAERMPVWSPDGSRLVFSSPRNGNPPSLFEKLSNGGSEQLLFRSDYLVQPTDWSRDGRFVVYARRDPRTQWDLWVVPASPASDGQERRPELFLQTPFAEHHGHLSADGRWMAYASDESGRWEVYVRAFPPQDGRWQISTDGGVEPRWRSDGKELFYVSSDGALMAVALQFDGMKIQPAAARALFKARFATFGSDMWRPVYVPAHDGQRFLVNILVEETAPSPITMVLNWPGVVKER
jgi:Tol biopolymer transport system component